MKPSITKDFAGKPATAEFERRDGERTLTTYRLVIVLHQNDEGLARCRNISDSGMKLDLGMDIEPGELIEIVFSPSVVLLGRIIWRHDGSCGVEFLERIDSAQLLSRTALEIRSPGARAPRLKIETTAVVRYEENSLELLVHDVSLNGMKVSHNGELRPGQRIGIVLQGQSERPGVVRWTREKSAGLMLLEPFSVEELGSLRYICGGSG